MITQEQEAFLIANPQFDPERHGGLYDRGRADSYYGRGINPHWYPNGTHNGAPVTNLTHNERKEYLRGYDDNEASGDFKSWF